MRWIKYLIFFFALVFGIYAIAMRFVPESKDYTLIREIDYPVEKVFPQFSNLENFSRWNSFFAENKNLNFTFFSPYEGQGSSMAYVDKKDRDTGGELFVRYQNPLRTIRYQLFEKSQRKPFLLDVKFQKMGNKTRILWFLHTPQQSYLKRSVNLISEDEFGEKLDASMRKLADLLSNKVEREREMQNLKFDSIFVEKVNSRLLLGVNITSKNEKNALFRNIVMNHNKVLNFVKMDLGKREDEFGSPVLITDADGFKDKEISYFYGVPLSRKTTVSDNNFSFRSLPATQNYVMFYKGSYSGRVKAIQQLLLRAAKDSMKTTDIHQIFMEDPADETNTVMKLSLPASR